MALLIISITLATVNQVNVLATCCGVEVISVETGRMIGEAWASNYYYYRNEEMSVKVTAINNEATTKTATIYVGAFDDLHQLFGFYLEDVTFYAGEIRSMYCTIYIPKWAFSGNRCHVTATAKTLPEGTFCPQNTDDFCLLPGMRALSSYLIVKTLTTSESQIYDMTIWIDGDVYPTSVPVLLSSGTHMVKLQLRYCGFQGQVCFLYCFQCWEDGSTSNPRAMNIDENTIASVTAHYIKYRSPWQPI